MPGRCQRILRTSAYNIAKRLWRSIDVISEDLDHVIYRFGSNLLWNKDQESLLIIGGSDVSHSSEEEGVCI